MGRLRALKPTGRLVRIRLKDIDAFLESGSSIKEDA
jgi:excisionase family DNA binding protein